MIFKKRIKCCKFSKYTQTTQFSEHVCQNSFPMKHMITEMDKRAKNNGDVLNMSNVDSYTTSLHSKQLTMHIVTSNIMTYKNVNKSNVEEISDNVWI